MTVLRCADMDWYAVRVNLVEEGFFSQLHMLTLEANVMN